jgi:hypothetical protein
MVPESGMFATELLSVSWLQAIKRGKSRLRTIRDLEIETG